MVFALDRTGHVYWFWPAWNAAADDPAALAIATGPAPVELAEAVRHPFPPGPLTVHALFTRRPYHVREIEAAAAGQALADLEGVLLSHPLEVLP
jgi:hypothetical protein